MKRARLSASQARADSLGGILSIPDSFAQLKADITNNNFLSALGKYAVDDPAKLDRLTLANLQENRQARNSLPALNAARSCLFGDRQLGDRKWYSDKPGIAARLKTQAQRRQFRMGLVANLAFYNILNQNDVHRLLYAGTNMSLDSLPYASKIAIAQAAQTLQHLSPMNLLRMVAPKKAVELEIALREVSALASYNQSLCGHLAASEAVEPAHAVVCEVLRTGADFSQAFSYQPVHIAAQAVAHLCTKPDVDGLLTPKPKIKKEPTTRRFRYHPGVCFNFQRGACTRDPCQYKHVCGYCTSPNHGGRACPTPPN